MRMVSVDDFKLETECFYKGDYYLVRDNGAILRKSRLGKRRRPLDDKWTFGNPCDHHGYMTHSNVSVHRVVATAFHGEPSSKDLVVDHIDTNRLNNRPENLRWVTRLENILENPKTLRRIESTWGSVERLLNDPNPAEKTAPIINRSWLIEALIEETIEEESTIDSLTKLAMQRDWRTPSEFPMCLDHLSDTPLDDYVSCLKVGAVFSRNQYGESVVDTAEISEDGSCLSVICIIDMAVKDYALAKVTIEEGKFIHASVSTYFTYDGVEKSHCALIGRPWEEPEGYQGCIDDYC